MKLFILRHKLLSLFLFALLLRLLVYFPINYILYDGEIEHPDSVAYHQFATWVSEVRWKEVNVFEWTRLIVVDWKTRGYPYVPYPEYGYGMALSYNILGVNRFWPELGNMIVGSLIPILGFLTLRQLSSTKVAVIGGVLLAIDPYAIYLSTQLLKDTAVIFFLALVLFTLTNTRHWKYSGAAFILLGLLRFKFALAVGPLVVLYIAFKYRKKAAPALVSLFVGGLIIVGLNSESLLKDNPLTDTTAVNSDAEIERAKLYLDMLPDTEIGPNQDPITGRTLIFDGEIQPPVTHTEFFSPRAAYLLQSIVTFQVSPLAFAGAGIDFYTFPRPWDANTPLEYGFAGYMAYWYILLFIFLTALLTNKEMFFKVWPFLLLGTAIGLLLTLTTPGASTLVRWRLPTYYPVVLSIAVAFAYLPTTKRFLDITLALAAGIILFPVWLGVIVYQGTGPIIFKQERIGKGGKPFLVWKFATMYPNSDGTPVVNNSDPRITSIGRILRRFALDEIPQVINVLKGEMSIVGPRAIATWEYNNASNVVAGWYERVDVTPGMIGLAQVKGNRSDNVAKLYWDVEYIARQSILLDLQILVKGLVRCFRGKW